VLSLVTDRIVCVSDFEKSAAIAIGISENKCVVVQNGIADDKPSQSLPSQSLEPRRLRVLFIGRFDRQKGFDTYLEVMSRFEDIADGYAVGGFIVNRAREVSIPANVEISGWKSRDDLDEIYRSADLLLMPSRADSSPLVAMEAMRAGLPVFASRVGGIPEIVIDGETGRLFDPTDIEQAADMIRSVSRTKLQEYGANSRVRFEKHFTATRMSASLLDHYHQLASRRERSALS
jgi:glycosyltransferase involved in cell wall biosynthesis